MDNKYYSLFISEEIDDSILDEKPGNMEDHFWHMACLSIYYKKKEDAYLEKMCLQKACDINYDYNAICFFDKKGVLPPKYRQYTAPFNHSMRHEKLEERIKYYNKKSSKGKNIDFIWYSLLSLSIIPVMLLLVFVFKMNTTYAAIIAILLMFGTQFLLQRVQKRRKMSKYQRPIERKLENYLKYRDRFIPLYQNELYLDLIRAKKEEDENKIIEKIKNGENK